MGARQRSLPCCGIAVKATEAKPGAQIVEREFGMFEVHSLNQSAVKEAAGLSWTVLAQVEDRIKPQVVSSQVITRVDPTRRSF